MKKTITAFALVCSLLILASCSSNMNKDEVVQKKDKNTKQETSIVPSYQLSKNTYKMILPYKPSAARGVIDHQVGNRLDIDEMEQGLRRLSKDVFDPNEVYYQEGQYLKEDTVYSLIDKLNPGEKNFKSGTSKKEKIKYYKDHPRDFSHILEQNYVKKGEDKQAKLAGVSIGIAMKSEYNFHVPDNGPAYHAAISTKEILKKGNKVAQEVLKEMRKIKGLGDVPIFITLYQEEKQSSPVPGNYIAKTLVKSGDNAIGDWTTVNEDYVLFPSDEAKKKHVDDSQLVKSFENEVQKYFPNYVGVIGKGFYEKKELRKLTLDIPIDFYDKGEVIGFTQYTYGLIKEIFPNYVNLEVRIISNEKLESFIYRDSGDDKLVARILD